VNQPQAGFNLALVASWNMTKNLAFALSSGSFISRSHRLEYHFQEEDDVAIKSRTDRGCLPRLPFASEAHALTASAMWLPLHSVGGKLSKDMQSQEETNQQLQSEYILRLGIGQLIH